MDIDNEIKDKILIQIKKDLLFLKNNNIMDYSLLIGIHYSNNINIANEISIFSSKDKNKLYFISFIDILTEYSNLKKIEYYAKRIFHGKGASCIPPNQYLERFYNFVKSIL